jgi:SAM-dependent methyltransferase
MVEKPKIDMGELYDFFYEHSHMRDYDEETRWIAKRIQALQPKAKAILDIGCATGEHARRLSPQYEVDGLDKNSDFIQRAAAKNPSGQFISADLSDFDMQKQYDILLCLSGTIAYVKTSENLIQALKIFRDHLAQDGYILLEPWFSPPQETEAGDYPAGIINMFTAETPDQKVCRMVHTQRRGNLSVLNFVYLIGRTDGIQLTRELHELGLFTREEMEAAFSGAGLQAQYEEGGLSGRGLYSAHR